MQLNSCQFLFLLPFAMAAPVVKFRDVLGTVAIVGVPIAAAILTKEDMHEVQERDMRVPP